MAKYINADELKDWVENWWDKNKYYHPYSKNNTIPISELYDILEQIPTADVVESKTSQWVKMSDADGVYWACNECGEDIPRISHYNPQFDLFPRLESIDRTKYCPNCGARMEVSE